MIPADRNSIIIYLLLNHFPGHDMEIHKKIENLRRMRLGSPLDLDYKLMEIKHSYCQDTIQCLDSAGTELVEQLQYNDLISNNELFWLQRRVHLLPYFDILYDSKPIWSEIIVNKSMDHPWFFYLMYSDPLI